MLEIFSAALPVLVSDTDCDVLVVFKRWLANVRLEDDKLNPGAEVAAPVR
jgi:hypothetical protein